MNQRGKRQIEKNVRKVHPRRRVQRRAPLAGSAFVSTITFDEVYGRCQGKRDREAVARCFKEANILRGNFEAAAYYRTLQRENAPAKAAPAHLRRIRSETGTWQNAGAVPRRGSDVGTSPLLGISGSGGGRE